MSIPGGVITARRSVAIGVAVALIMSGLAWAQATLGRDPRASLCGADRLPVVGAFALAHASEVREHIPKMLPSPELDTSDHPAYVVILRGPVDLPILGFNTGVLPQIYRGDMVCVVVDDVPNYYTRVDLDGWHG